MKKQGRRILLVFILLGAAAVSVRAEREVPSALPQLVYVFTDAMQLVSERYLREVSPKELLYGAIQGMLQILDPESQFLTPEELRRLRMETEGEFVGIGAKVNVREDGLLIDYVLENTPASEAGLKTGDVIVSVDGKPLEHIPRSEALELLKGKPGSSIDIGLKLKGEDVVTVRKISRAHVDIPHVKDARIVASKVGYVRIVEFGEKTRIELIKALAKLRRGGANRFILDVRDNPGGTLEAAAGVAELFLSRGDLIVSTVGRRSAESFEITAKETGAYSAAPLAILINKGSASASEVLAAALKDHNRAKLFGTASFGKASVQALLTLRDGSAIRITTAEYFTPNKNAINRVGLKPDFLIEGEEAQLKEAASYLENISPTM